VEIYKNNSSKSESESSNRRADKNGKDRDNKDVQIQRLPEHIKKLIQLIGIKNKVVLVILRIILNPIILLYGIDISA